MKILVLGAGGVGGYFGAKLMRAGADVTFVLRDKRRRLIREQGLRIESPQDSFTVFPHCLGSEELAPDYDLIMLAPKAYDLDDALASIAGASGRGALLPFLNGLNHIALLDQRFGRQRVMGGVAHIAAMLTERARPAAFRPVFAHRGESPCRSRSARQGVRRALRRRGFR